MGRAVRPTLIFLSFVIAVVSSSANAVETITYTYDAKGRLVKVERTGTVNNGVVVSYQHDKTDNRTNVTVTGSPNNSPPP
ncbi:MAG TPA: RHS repeat domain-containing protein [Allosphingosinicella sp.]|jgi:YD repeat-containing protein